MFERISSITNIRVWFKQPNWKRSKRFGRSCINLVRNGVGLKINFVFTNKDNQKMTFDMPLLAIKKIMEDAQEIGFSAKGRNMYSWRYIDWRKDGNN